jgi:hypothetical protein
MIIRVRNRQLLGALIGVVGLAIILLGVPYLAYRAIELATNGVQISAAVTGKTTEDTSNPNVPQTTGQTAYHVQYTFTPPGGQPVTGDDIVSQDDWTSLDLGAPITITYVRSDPGTSEIGTAQNASIGYVAFLIPIAVGLLFTVLGGRLFLDARAEANLRARMLRLGVAALGTVLNPRATVAFFSQQPYERLSYRYADKLGRQWTGLSDWQPVGISRQWQAGATGHVRYDPAKPASSFWFGAVDPGANRSDG